MLDLMRDHARGRLNNVTVMRIFCNVLEAVAYMHARRPPIAHRDIKVSAWVSVAVLEGP